MALVAAISHLTHRVEQSALDRLQVRAELRKISARPRQYGRVTTILMVGLACAAFSRLLGGDWLAFVITLAAASAAMLVRQELTRLGFNAYLVTLVTALAAY